MDENLVNVKKLYDAKVDLFKCYILPNEYDLFEVQCIDRFLDNLEIGFIIDLGCGAGRISNYCIEKGFKVLGCDISSKMIFKAKEHAFNNESINFIECDMQNISSVQKYVGAIACFSFIHLTEKQVRNTLSNLHVLLEKDGELIIVLIPGSVCDYIEEPTDENFKIFLKEYSESEIKQILNSEGYEVTNITP